MVLDINNRCITVAIPKGLKDSFNKYMAENPPMFKFKVHIDHFYYIFAKIHGISHSKPKYRTLDKVPVSAKILMHELGRHYRRYIDYLIEAGFLDTDNHYVVADNVKQGKCKCFSLTGEYKCAKKLEKVEIHSKSIIGHYLKWKTEMFSKVADDEMLSKLFDMVQKFHIDTDEAERYLRKLQTTDSKITNEWIDNEMGKCARINDKDAVEKAMFIVKDPYNRVHTNITNLSKHVRENFLYMGNEKVKSIDIVSSQASLLYLMMKQERDRIADAAKNPAISAFAPEGFIPGYDIRDKYVNARNSYTGAPMLQYLTDTTHVSTLGMNTYDEALRAVDRDLDKMRTTLVDGIYEFFVDRWNEKFANRKNRTEIKKKWITYVFGKSNENCKRMRSIWDEEFPMLSRMIDNFKINDYRVLAHKLQRTEADLVYNKVCRAIDDNIGIDYGTVHDSLLVPESAYNDAKHIFSLILEDNGIITGVK